MSKEPLLPQPVANVPCPASGCPEEESIEAAMAGLAPAEYAAIAKRKNKRSLHCMLRDARKKLAHHGKASFMGREAQKEIHAVENELSKRGLAIPGEGQETAQWNTKSNHYAVALLDPGQEEIPS